MTLSRKELENIICIACSRKFGEHYKGNGTKFNLPELMSLAKQERELLREQKRLRCERDHACSVMDIIHGVQIG